MESNDGKSAHCARHIEGAVAEEPGAHLVSGRERELLLVASFRIDQRRLAVVNHTIGGLSDQRCVGELEFDNRRFLILLDDELVPNGRDPADLLTPRELQIARLVARGRPNKQIAFQLKISEWTVTTHVRRILDKLGVENRAAMVFRCSGFL